MRKILIMAAMLALFAATAQTKVTVTKDGNYVAAAKSKQPDKLTGKTYTDSKGKKFDVFVNSKGKEFIKKVSAKSGKEYKQYLTPVF